MWNGLITASGTINSRVAIAGSRGSPSCLRTLYASHQQHLLKHRCCVIVAVEEGELDPLCGASDRHPHHILKDDAVGNGLGLATAKKVIEALGGEILVESEPNRGSVFTILIPK